MGHTHVCRWLPRRPPPWPWGWRLAAGSWQLGTRGEGIQLSHACMHLLPCLPACLPGPETEVVSSKSRPPAVRPHLEVGIRNNMTNLPLAAPVAGASAGAGLRGGRRSC